MDRHLPGRFPFTISRRRRDSQPDRPSAEAGHFSADGREIRLGSAKVSRTFGSFAASLAMHACQRMVVRLGATSLVNFENFAASPPQDALRCDVDDSEGVFYNYYASMPDGTVVSCLLVEHGISISVYADDQDAALEFLSDLDAEIEASNVYRGKCLYFTGKEIEFKRTPKIAWEDVILPKKIKDEIFLHTVTFLKSKKSHEAGILKRGVILHGRPGTGKTTAIRALFSLLEGSGITRIYVTSGSFERMSMDGFFATLRYVLPAIVCFEDLDFISPNRHIYRGGVTGALLSRLDGIDKVTKPLVVLGTTNDIQAVDDALTNRPARFDRVIEIPLPSQKEIVLFYKRLLGEDPPAEIVKDSEGLTGAHISEVYATSRLMSDQDGCGLTDALATALKAVRRSFGNPTKKSGFGSVGRDMDEDWPDEDQGDTSEVDPDGPPNQRNLE